MPKYTVRLDPNTFSMSVEADNEGDAIDKVVDMATGGYADLWDLFHHCNTEVELEN